MVQYTPKYVPKKYLNVAMYLPQRSFGQCATTTININIHNCAWRHRDQQYCLLVDPKVLIDVEDTTLKDETLGSLRSTYCEATY